MAKGFEITGDGVNLRIGPGKNYDSIEKLNKGDVLVSTGWLPVQTDPISDKPLYISIDFAVIVDLVPDPEEIPLPVHAPDPLPPGKVLHESDLDDLYGPPKDPAVYLVVMDFREFKNDFVHVKDWEGNAWSCRVYGHELMEKPLRQAYKNLVERGFAKELKTFDGCTCVRPIGGSNRWSTHARGLAVDHNAKTNARGAKPTLSAGFVKCFVDAGFYWGGNFTRQDGMHFQLPCPD